MDFDEFWKGIVDGISGDYYESNSKKSYPEYGDIICIDAGAIYHYGVYENDASVIHFAPMNYRKLKLGELLQRKKDAVIHVTGLHDFLNSNREFFVCNCPKIPVVLTGIPDPLTAMEYKLYTPEQTIERAYNLLNKKDYSLFKNNCETFAFWCKTGIHEWLQSVNYLKGVRMDKIKV